MRIKTDPTRAIDRHIGEQIKLLRQIRRQSQHEIASKLGISYQQLHKYEAGTNSISASRLFQIAQLFEIAPAVFFDGLTTNNALTPRVSARDDSAIHAYLNAVPLGQREALIELLKTLSKK